MGVLFGTDGIRGKANEYPLDAGTAMKAGMALAAKLSQTATRPRVVMGRDTRISGDMIRCAIAAGLCAGGADVEDAGVVTTPAVAYLTLQLEADAGVVISASHNPFEDNGIKIFSSAGTKLADEMELELEDYILGKKTVPLPHRDDIGTLNLLLGGEENYAGYLVKSAGALNYLKGKTIVVDAANGAASAIAPKVFKRLGINVVRMGMSPDGLNINENVGALYPNSMCERVVTEKAFMGVCFDGDADRIMLSDENGTLLDGDCIMAFAARYMKSKGILEKNSVVGTVMSNLGFELGLKDMGVTLIREQVGDRYVSERMRAEGYNLGGEQSGHIIFSDNSTTGDGLLSAMITLKIIEDGKIPASALGGLFKRFPQEMINVKVARKPPIDDMPLTSAAIKDASAHLGDKGRVLVRYSGTEFKCRVMVEGVEEDVVKHLTKKIADVVKREIGA